MKRLLVSTLAALLMHTSAFAELSCAVPAPKPAKHIDGTALSIDLGDTIVSRPARIAPAELPRNAPDFGASMPLTSVPAAGRRPNDLSSNEQTAEIGSLLEFGAGSFAYLFALVVVLYVRSARARARMLLTRPRHRLRSPSGFGRPK